MELNIDCWSSNEPKMPDLGSGWSLMEASEKICIEEWAHHRKCLDHLRELEGPEYITFRYDYDPNTDRERAHQASVRRAKSRTESAFKQTYHALREHLVAGRLLAWGSLDNPSSYPKLIRPQTWRSLTTFNYDDELAGYWSKSTHTVYYGVSVYPLYRVPDAMQQFDGLSLRDALAGLILDDPELAALVGSLSWAEAKPRTVRQLLVPEEGSLPWSVTLDEEMLVRLIKKQASEDMNDIIGTPEFATLIDAVCDRFSALMRALGSNQLRAKGLDPMDLNRTIDGKYWLLPDTYVELKGGTVGVAKNARPLPSNRQVDWNWRGIVLRVAPETTGKAITIDEFNLDAQKHRWQEALGYLLIRLSSEEKPESGAQLTRWMEECFQDPDCLGVKNPPDADQIENFFRTKFLQYWKEIVRGAKA